MHSSALRHFLCMHHFLEVSVFSVYHSDTDKGEAVQTSPNSLTFNAFGEAIFFLYLLIRFVFLKCLWTISFTFYIKCACNKCWKNFFRPIFLVLILFKWYQNMSGWGTGTCLTITPIATDFILILCYLSVIELNK